MTTRVKAIFLAQREYGICWPGNRYDINGCIQGYSEKLLEMGERLGVDMECSPPLYEESQVAELLREEEDAPSDGILVLALGLRTWKLADKVAQSERPTVIYTPLFCFCDHIRELSHREGVYLISTLDFDALEYGIRMLRAAEQLRSARIIVVRGEEPNPSDSVIPSLNTKVRTIARNEFLEQLRIIGETEEVRAITTEYIQQAEKVVEPTGDDIANAVKTYIASRNILEKFEGDAISLDCLGLLGAGLIDTTPCLGFSRLNDEGVPAGCEADLDSILTLLLLQYLFSQPGFITDPTVDTVKNTWIGSHCTCATKLSGTDGRSAPFLLRGYAHLDLGVSPQVLWEEGQEVTLIKFRPREGTMKIGRGKVVGNIDFAPPANMCITSVEVEVYDVEDVRDVEGSIHVILVHGDRTRELSAFCQLMGIRSSPILADR